MKVRTNIAIEERCVEDIKKRYGRRTKTEAVDRALRKLALEPMSLEEALAMEGQHNIGEIPPDCRRAGLSDASGFFGVGGMGPSHR